jgi:hypothetical protein
MRGKCSFGVPHMTIRRVGNKTCLLSVISVRTVLMIRLVYICVVFLLSTSQSYAEENEVLEKIVTRFGSLETVRSDKFGSTDTIKFRDKTVFHADGDFDVVSIHGYVKLKHSDVAIFSADCNGANCGSATLYFIVLTQDQKPIILPKDGFLSGDGTIKLFQKNGVAMADLGFSKGRRLFAELNSNRVIFHSNVEKNLAMNESDCRWIYDISKRDCTINGEIKLSCAQSDESSLSFAAQGGLRSQANHPGYVSSSWRDSCVSWCKGNKIEYDEFKKSVCSIEAR